MNTKIIAALLIFLTVSSAIGGTVIQTNDMVFTGKVAFSNDGVNAESLTNTIWNIATGNDYSPVASVTNLYYGGGTDRTTIFTQLWAVCDGGSAVVDLIWRGLTNKPSAYTTAYTGLFVNVTSLQVSVNISIPADSFVGFICTNTSDCTNLNAGAKGNTR